MSNTKIRIKLKAYDVELIEESCKRLIDSIKKSGCECAGPIPMPTRKEVITILRSPHKHKDSREQFFLNTHKRIIDIYSPNSKIVDMLTKIVLPSAVNIKIEL